ncbi:hypothetical protein HYH03_012900 [Edaphochlamys debaryana]|uniref:carbonic anhydrase n=1 Tax=Edaphochlamys debaryana TaxID=47281 RepID=A0A835XR51_9CHLO|nr:hypothetical protein HYH03_012900 [Edaphochlamys debaryana]|eukprot:KAG2488581.1 hypothetical protein HYH03_012900 [Edaphochlamys debaryana]
MASTPLLLLLCLGVLGIQGCVFKEGVDATGKPWVCMSGTRQSPINVPWSGVLDHKGSHVQPQHQTHWHYSDLVSNGSNVEVINNGHTIQIEWLYAYDSNVQIAVPVNPNENTTSIPFWSCAPMTRPSKYYPLEMHIVHRVYDLPSCSAGCLTVTGILFNLVAGSDNPLLSAIWDNMPMREGQINYLPEGAAIRLEKFFPAPEDREYVAYSGSLTTPPCSEGLLWQVITKPQPISPKQWNQYRRAIGLKNCTDAAHETPASEEPHHDHHHRLHRHLLEETAPAEHHTDPNAYTCEVIAYGENYRNTQPTNRRKVKLALSKSYLDSRNKH